MNKLRGNMWHDTTWHHVYHMRSHVGDGCHMAKSMVTMCHMGRITCKGKAL